MGQARCQPSRRAKKPVTRRGERWPGSSYIRYRRAVTSLRPIKKEKVTAQVVSCRTCGESKLKGSGALGPQRGAGRSPAAFSRQGSRERSGREPCRFFPFPNPMDEVHGGKMFWRQLNSRFRGVQTRILGSCRKRFKPALLPAFREQQGGKKKGKKGSYGGFAPIAPENKKIRNCPGCVLSDMR